MPRTAFACVGVFARTNQRALEWARARSAQLVTEVNAATREAIREIIGLAFEEGLPPREAARLLRDVVGLHSRDAAAVADYRADLLARGASTEFAEAKAARYSRKLLNARTETIARTESMAAANAGQEELWQQAVERGELPEDIYEVWITTPDDALCPECAAMEGALTKVGEPFVDAGGFPPLHPNCRCVTGIALPEDLERAGITEGAS